MATNLYLTLKLTTIDLIGGIFCKFCHIALPNKKDFSLHYESHVNSETSDSTIIYTCVACRTEFDAYNKFRDHCYKHLNKDRYKCEECPKVFSKAAALQIHNNTMHNFICPPPCNKKFSTKKELILHKIIHTQTNKLPTCYKCEETIINHDSCAHHIDQHTTYIYPCPICNLDCTSKVDAIKHVKVHFDNKTEVDINAETHRSLPEDSCIDLVGISCHLCEDLFQNRTEFDGHFASEHTGDPIYSCTICDKQFNKYISFGHHCYEHSRKGRFECDECSQSFPRLSLLVLHSNTAHGVSETDGHRCTECGKKFPTHYKIRAHLREQHNIDGYKCECCFKIFDSSRELVSHQRVHSYNDNWCRQCSFIFTNVNACVNHLELHKKINYCCPVCKKTYAEKRLILRHATTHFEATLCICKICGKSFTARNRLVEHSKIHSERSRFTCTHCGKGFTKEDILDDHMNMHTGRKPYVCTECPKTFASYPNCYKHMVKIHKVQPKKKSELNHINNKIDKAKAAKNEPEKPGNEVEVGFADVKLKMCQNNILESDINSNFADIAIEKTSLVELKPEDLNQLDDIDIETDFSKPTNPEDNFMYSIVTDNNQDYIDLNAIGQESKILEDVSSMTSNDVNFTELMSAASQVPDYPVPVFEEIPPAPEFQPADIPREYGPDFDTYAMTDVNGLVVNMDEHATLPHIDPKHLTLETNTQNDTDTCMYTQNYAPNDSFNGFNDKYVWEPPIITIVYGDDANNDICDVTGGILPMMRQDMLY